MLKTYLLALVPCLALLAACSSDGIPGTPNTGGGSGVAGAGQAGASNAGAAGTPVGGAGASGAGTAGSGGAAPIAGAGGAVPVAGAGGAAGAAGAGTAGAGGAIFNLPKGGKSAGCGKTPAGDSVEKYILHTVDIMGLNAVYLPGGELWEKKKNDGSVANTPWSWAHRAYSVKLPKNYDPNKAYPVTMAGGGCGGSTKGFAEGPSGGYQPDGMEAIQVGLSYLAGCFDDGGPSLEVTNPDKTKSIRKDTPEEPYVRAVIAAVQSNYCVEKSQMFLSGSSSGGWESFTVGCAASDLIRSIGTVSGGLRLNRPMCPAPSAAFMIEAMGDNENPIGPMEPPVGRLDSPGSGPARDEILKRNGCVAPDFQFVYGGAGDDGKYTNAPHEVWDPAYPRCMKYTGCPAAYPVVWCSMRAIDNCGHQCDKDSGVEYKKGMTKFFQSLAPKAP